MKFKSVGYLMIVIAAASVISACSTNEPSDVYVGKVNPKSIELSPSTRSMAKTLEPGFLRYTTDCVKYALDENPETSSLATSPLSITMLMGLIANGVNEESRKEITDYLGTDDIATLNEYCKAMLDELPGVHPRATVSLANSVWVNKYCYNLSINKDYKTILNNYFNGESFNYDFTKDPGRLRKDVNNWSAKNTGGLIPNLDKELALQDSGTLLLLLNSLYFKAPWEHFLKENTKKGEFHGSKIDMLVEMMTSKPLVRRPYYKDDNFDIFAIDLADGAYWLHIILPREDLSLREAAEIMTPEFMEKVNDESVNCTLTVSMPKFTIKSSMGLSDLLMKNGVKSFMKFGNFTMFESAMDLDAASHVGQSTVFSIDETGAQVASTSFDEWLIGNPAIDPSKNYQLTVDRPFIYYITETSTQAWITSGFFANPPM